jgi:N-acetylmuramoyl-L-alanine amidase
LNSTNRLRAKAGRTAALAFALAFACVVPLCAQTLGSAGDFWFAGTRLLFEHPELHEGAIAVGTDDDGLARFASKVGAVVSYQPGQKYIVIADSQRRSITFTIGDPHFTVAGVVETAAFAPYVEDGAAYLPLLDLARALYVDPISDSGLVVLQPQIAALDVRTVNGITLVTLHGAAPLRFKRLSKAGDDTVALAFSGTGSTLESDRVVNGTTLRDVAISVSGPAKNPTTIFTFSGAAGGVREMLPSDSPNAVTLAFGPPGAQVGGSAIPASGGNAIAVAPYAAIDPRPTMHPVAAAPTLPPYGDTTLGAPSDATVAPAPFATQTPTADGLTPATITGFDTQSVDDGFDIKLSITGPVTYEWHRLADDRWYVDFKPANLAIPEQEQPLADPSILSLRIKPFVGPIDHLATVRVAFTLPSQRAVALVPSPDGMTIEIDSQDDTGVQTAGTGELTGGKLVAAVVPLPVVAAAPVTDNADQSWKFSPADGARNPKMIVIDPGHGGSDRGAQHHGLTEADLNLDVSRRLRAVLISRGWQVKMTRDTDVDVYAPNDSARDELQARDDIANAAGARLLVSVHTNAFTSSELNGTTTYYYTASSHALARAVHARLAAALPTSDDGIRKENFYVIHHQKMPGILVEMAFLSNAGDAKLLSSSAFLQSMAVAIADGIDDYTSGAGQPVSSNTLDTSGAATDGN